MLRSASSDEPSCAKNIRFQRQKATAIEAGHAAWRCARHSSGRRPARSDRLARELWVWSVYPFKPTLRRCQVLIRQSVLVDRCTCQSSTSATLRSRCATDEEDERSSRASLATGGSAGDSADAETLDKPTTTPARTRSPLPLSPIGMLDHGRLTLRSPFRTLPPLRDPPSLLCRLQMRHAKGDAICYFLEWTATARVVVLDSEPEEPTLHSPHRLSQRQVPPQTGGRAAGPWHQERLLDRGSLDRSASARSPVVSEAAPVHQMLSPWTSTRRLLARRTRLAIQQAMMRNQSSRSRRNRTEVLGCPPRRPSEAEEGRASAAAASEGARPRSGQREGQSKQLSLHAGCAYHASLRGVPDRKKVSLISGSSSTSPSKPLPFDHLVRSLALPAWRARP